MLKLNHLLMWELERIQVKVINLKNSEATKLRANILKLSKMEKTFLRLESCVRGRRCCFNDNVSWLDMKCISLLSAMCISTC